MDGLKHKLYLSSFVLVTVVIFVLFGIYGSDYYLAEITERFHHARHELLKPSGLIGHGAGIVGSFMILVGVFGYMARKRLRRLSRLGILKHWLEFHIFLCSLGPVLVLYHTSFKFGGLVAISFWFMVAVVFSGIIGRFIYLQIPRTIEGRELSLNELTLKRAKIQAQIQKDVAIEEDLKVMLEEKSFAQHNHNKGTFLIRIIRRFFDERKQIKTLKVELQKGGVQLADWRKIRKQVKSEIVLNRRISWLSTMQKYMQYWHVLHLPLALTMLVIMLVHVAVAILFGYVWIF